MKDVSNTYIVLFFLAIVFSLAAQIVVKLTYSRQSKVLSERGITGFQAAKMVLEYYGINYVNIAVTSGKLTDHYNNKNNVINLSDEVYNGTSIAAIGVACHEAGHAAQYSQNYLPIRIRNTIIPLCNIGSHLGVPLALLGYFMSFEPLISVGLMLYASIAIFQLVTLPIELNASFRAMSVIKEANMLSGTEIIGARAVLGAAAMTYVAALFSSLITLLRLFLMFKGKRR